MPDEKKYKAELMAAVNSPQHYTQGNMETIDMIKESLTEMESYPKTK